MTTWNIQYENDIRPSIQMSGSMEKAERIAKRKNKYDESYTITEAPKEDMSFEIEKAHDEAIKYGCAIPPKM